MEETGEQGHLLAPDLEGAKLGIPIPSKNIEAMWQ